MVFHCALRIECAYFVIMVWMKVVALCVSFQMASVSFNLVLKWRNYARFTKTCAIWNFALLIFGSPSLRANFSWLNDWISLRTENIAMSWLAFQFGSIQFPSVLYLKIMNYLLKCQSRNHTCPVLHMRSVKCWFRLG